MDHRRDLADSRVRGAGVTAVNLSSIPFRWSDAWLLLAVVWSTRGGQSSASLDEVIGAGDAIDHAIFNFEELDGGIARLGAGNLIVVDGGTFHLSSDGKSLHEPVTGATAWASVSAIAHELRVPEPYDTNARYVDPAWSARLFTRDDMRDAVERYRAQ